MNHKAYQGSGSMKSKVLAALALGGALTLNGCSDRDHLNVQGLEYNTNGRTLYVDAKTINGQIRTIRITDGAQSVSAIDREDNGTIDEITIDAPNGSFIRGLANSEDLEKAYDFALANKGKR